MMRDQSRSTGTPDSLRQQMERSFGADFSNVRVHGEARADRVAQDLHARAFATGQDVFFKSGEYAPASTRGTSLIGHEAAHVMQQAGRSTSP